MANGEPTGAHDTGARLVELNPRLTNDDLADVMRQTLDYRARHGEDAVVTCALGGFDDDPRPVADIPEARAFCRRLVSIGLIAVLEPTTTLVELMSGPLARISKGKAGSFGLGAFELWVIAEGLVGEPFGDRLEKFFGEVWPAAARAADERLDSDGPAAGDDDWVTE
jgi:hypothetical protein